MECALSIRTFTVYLTTKNIGLIRSLFRHLLSFLKKEKVKWGTQHEANKGGWYCWNTKRNKQKDRIEGRLEADMEIEYAQT